MVIESEIKILFFQDYLSLFTNKKNILSTMAHQTVESKCDLVLHVPSVHSLTSPFNYLIFC